MGLLDILYDANNCENIVMYNEANEAIEFVQIALIPMNDVAYTILKPAAAMDGLSDDEALVFRVDEYEDDAMLTLEVEESIIDAVFAIYNKLFDELD